MKKTKKIIAMALSLVMVLGVAAGFSGCSKNPVEVPDNDPIVSTDPTSEPTTEPIPIPEAEEGFEYASVVYVSVNPRFAIFFDADGNVIKTIAANDDGEELDMDLTTLADMTSADAVTTLLETIAEAGYFEDGKHDIELTFYGESEGEVDDLNTLGEVERGVYAAAKAFVEENDIKSEIKVKKSPDAASVKVAVDTAVNEEEPQKKEDLDKDITTTEPEANTDNNTDKETTDTETASAPVHQHDYHGDTVKATCTEGGYTTYTCDCGSTYTDVYTDPYGHDFENTTVKATYEAGGYILHECTVCGYAYKSDETPALTPPKEELTAKPTEKPTDESEKDDPTCPHCGGGHYFGECPNVTAEPTPAPRKCAYCGSTSCDYPKTGDKTKCEGYDKKKDATLYCQTCGKSTSICESWVVDVQCERCGASVAAFECHHCSKR